MDQVSKASDEKLNQLSQKLGYAKLLTDKGTELHDEYWEEVYAIFEEHSGTQRFIANDGFYLHKESRQGSPQLNPAELEQKMHEEFPDPKEFQRRWNAITRPVPHERRVEPLLMERQVRLGHISLEMVNECIHTPPTSYARVRKVWSSDDFNRAVVFDVKTIDPTEVKQRRIAMLEELLAELKGNGVPGVSQ